MTKAETARVLTLIAAFDRRTIGEADVEAWYLVLSDLPADDCAAAVREHYTTSTDWLMPAHVRRLAEIIARRRAGSQARARIDAQIAAANGGDHDPNMSGGPAMPLAIEAAPLNSRIGLYQEGRRAAVEARRAMEEACQRKAAEQAERAAKRREALAELEPLRQDSA